VVQEAEDSRAQAAQKLSVLCAAIMQVNLQDRQDVSCSFFKDLLFLVISVEFKAILRCIEFGVQRR
jgi:hypothetical protein